MRVGIDCRSLTRGPAGVATYVRNLLRHLPQLQCLSSSFPANNLLWNLTRPPLAVWWRKWDLYHAPAYTAPLFCGKPLVLSVHDTSYLACPHWYPYRIDRLRKAYYLLSLRRAHRILVPSDFTAGEVARLVPRRRDGIRRIYLGVSTFFRRDPELAELVRRRYQLPRRFALHVGDLHRRRNPDRIQEACRSLGIPLVLVGRILEGGIQAEQFDRHVEYLKMEELKGFYSAASVFVYASEYEGFGLPLLEAMACSLPVVSSNRSCLPEICGDAAILVEPQVEGLREGIRQALEERQEWVARGLERARSFRWENTARQTLEAYRELAP